MLKQLIFFWLQNTQFLHLDFKNHSGLVDKHKANISVASQNEGEV